MSETQTPPHPYRPDESEIYEIRVRGHLTKRYSGWFGGMDFILEENGDTRMTGALADQAALYGLLKRIRDAGLTLLSIHRVTGGQVGDCRP